MRQYMLTAYGQSGWRDIQVDGAADIREAITLAEKATGCLVSHGRSGLDSGFHPGVVIDATTGQVRRVHNDPAKPEVSQGPPDVVRAIAQAIRSNKRSNNRA
jgi:hypothetical protein